MSETRTARLTVGALLAAAIFAHASRAVAQTESELQAARALFQEAYKDEQENRLDVALEKFQRVARVRESAAVRYRIASVLEGLGRLREARDGFRALAASKESLAANEQEIAESADERARALDARVATLALTLQGTPPSDLEVTVDGVRVPPEELSAPQALDPGEHVVAARGTGMTPFESRVRLSEGGAVAMTVPVGGAAEPPVAPSPVRVREGGGSVLGVTLLAAGGAAIVASGVLLVVREGHISELEEACPGGACPRSRQAELEGTRDRAETFGPLGIGLGIAGVVAGGVGAYLLLRSSPEPERPPAAEVSSVRVRFGAAPHAGGGSAVLFGAF